MDNCRCADARERIDDERYHVASYDVDTSRDADSCGCFRREPEWWRDDDAEQQRQNVFRNYEPSDIIVLIDEVVMYLDRSAETADECSQLIRRLLSLAWIADVCRGSMIHLPEDAHLDY